MSSRHTVSLPSGTQLFILLIIASFISLLVLSHLTNANSQQKQADTNTSDSRQTDNLTSEPEHWLVGSYYNTRNGMTATLLLNNKGIQPLEVRPTLYNMAGQELVLPPVIVGPSSHRFINLSEWARIGGKSFERGSIKLFHYGKDLVLGAQIYLVDELHSLSFDEKLAELGKFDSRRLEGVWAMPSDDTDVKVALSNTTNSSLSVTARLTRSPHNTGDAQSFDLQPRETRLLDLRRDFRDTEDNEHSEAIALSLEHAGAKEALLARAFISEEDRGYSNLAQFSNPTLGRSKAYHGAGLRLGTVAGERLMPVVVVRNTSSQIATLTGRVPYTRADGTTGTVILPRTRLKQDEVSLLDMRLVARRSETEAIKVAGLEIEYDAPAGSVLVAAHSESVSGNQVFRVPMWDVLAQRSPTGGYPWHIEDTSTTKAFIKNVTDLEQDYVAFLLYENGSRYMLGMKKIAPHQTIEIDVKALRDNQVPDESGVTIPLYVSSGQLQWTLRRRDEPARNDDELDKMALVGRSEQIDVVHGISSNYACQNCCAGTYLSGSIEPRDYQFDAGTVVEFQAFEEGQTCYGYQYPVRYYPTNWSSTNESVAIVGSNSGIVTMLAAGTAEIKASWSVERSHENYPCGGGGGYLTTSTSSEAIVAESTQEAARAIDIQPSIEACGTCVFSYTQTRPQAGLTVKPKVHIPIVDVENDDIETTLGPSGTGLFTLRWVGPNTSFTIAQETRGAGTFQDSFRLSDLTSGSTFTYLEAKWVVNGQTGTDTKSYRFTVLGDYINTCYNTPAESDYSGGSVTAGTSTSSCVWSSRTFFTAFLDSVNLNGSGVDSSSTPIQIEGFCGGAPGSSPAYSGNRYRRPTSITTSCNNSPTVDVTVASQSLACGTSVFIKTIGVRMVQDTGGGLANDQLDNYVGIGRSTCNGWSNDRRRTIRFN